MPVNFSCPHCGTTTAVADKYVGQTGPCGSCGEEVTIPVPDHGSPAAVQKPPVKSSSSSTAIVLVVVLVCGFVFLACGGVLVGLLLPAVQSARGAARRMSCQNNLKQIGLAMHNYHDTYRAFPPAYTVDEDGQPMHSWRTVILPFVEQQGLYDQIRLDEPWDSDYNSQFHNAVIDVYSCPADPEQSTSYVVIVGPNTAFPGSEQVSIADITDGTSNTILVTEVKGQSTTWMAPVDLEADKIKAAINAPGSIGSHHPGGAQCVFCDGSVRYISESADPKTLNNLMTRDDGQHVGDF